MMMIATFLAPVLLMTFVSGQTPTTTTTTPTTTTESTSPTGPPMCTVTLTDANDLKIPVDQNDTVTDNDGKDYVTYVCTDPTGTTNGVPTTCSADTCAYRNSTSDLHTCQACVKVYQAVSNCADEDGKDCTDTSLCSSNPESSSSKCCGTCKDYLD